MERVRALQLRSDGADAVMDLDGEAEAVGEQHGAPSSPPSEERVHEYALWLGLELPAEAALIWIARAALEAWSEPSEVWSECYTASGEVYYHDTSTGLSSWEHPADALAREQLEEERSRVRREAAVADGPGVDCEARLGDGDDRWSEGLHAGGATATGEHSQSRADRSPAEDPCGGDDCHSATSSAECDAEAAEVLERWRQTAIEAPMQTTHALDLWRGRNGVPERSPGQGSDAALDLRQLPASGTLPAEDTAPDGEWRSSQYHDHLVDLSTAVEESPAPGWQRAFGEHGELFYYHVATGAVSRRLSTEEEEANLWSEADDTVDAKADRSGERHGGFGSAGAAPTVDDSGGGAASSEPSDDGGADGVDGCSFRWHHRLRSSWATLTDHVQSRLRLRGVAEAHALLMAWRALLRGVHWHIHHARLDAHLPRGCVMLRGTMRRWQCRVRESRFGPAATSQTLLGSSAERHHWMHATWRSLLRLERSARLHAQHAAALEAADEAAGRKAKHRSLSRWSDWCRRPDAHELLDCAQRHWAEQALRGSIAVLVCQAVRWRTNRELDAPVHHHRLSAAWHSLRRHVAHHAHINQVLTAHEAKAYFARRALTLHHWCARAVEWRHDAANRSLGWVFWARTLGVRRWRDATYRARGQRVRLRHTLARWCYWQAERATYAALPSRTRSARDGRLHAALRRWCGDIQRAARAHYGAHLAPYAALRRGCRAFTRLRDLRLATHRRRLVASLLEVRLTRRRALAQLRRACTSEPPPSPPKPSDYVWLPPEGVGAGSRGGSGSRSGVWVPGGEPAGAISGAISRNAFAGATGGVSASTRLRDSLIDSLIHAATDDGRRAPEALPREHRRDDAPLLPPRAGAGAVVNSATPACVAMSPRGCGTTLFNRQTTPPVVTGGNAPRTIGDHARASAPVPSAPLAASDAIGMAATLCLPRPGTSAYRGGGLGRAPPLAATPPSSRLAFANPYAAPRLEDVWAVTSQSRVREAEQRASERASARRERISSRSWAPTLDALETLPQAPGAGTWVRADGASAICTPSARSAPAPVQCAPGGAITAVSKRSAAVEGERRRPSAKPLQAHSGQVNAHPASDRDRHDHDKRRAEGGWDGRGLPKSVVFASPKASAHGTAESGRQRWR